ncbi:MerR family transcriptional regulator [Streptomyces sp. NPDC102467]|uniref:MerR family transcriptional regulator n=1 Tax=Streptomyces sp. NPDC102467 TaxID=3366179 RepID=UPI00381BA078
MPIEHLRIGQVAQQAGVSTRALRYYEEQGLLEPQRTTSGQRRYPASAVARVQLIQQLFTAGLNSPLLATLLPAIDARHVDAELSARLLVEHARLEAEVAGLQAASRRLAALIGLVTHPDDASCPASLDEAVSDGAPASRGRSLRPARKVRVA